MSRLNFKLLAETANSKARATEFRTLHNEVQTPIFMPVGTHATVRAQRPETLEALKFPILLANTYHLMLRPGAEVFKHFGGIHKFMSWPNSVLTDSGGFQIFSLENSRLMTEEGARFKSYVDNSTQVLSPEISIETQKAIGSDIMMVLDQCIPSTAEEKEAKLAMELTHRWAHRSLLARGDSPQSLFGIVQGACFEGLRRQSADTLTKIPFDGFAIGGLAVGEGKSEREDLTEFTAALLPKNLPRYLMGVGTPIDLLEAVHRGVDMFDCILPTAMAQQGVAYTSQGKFDLRRGVYRFAEEGLDPECPCPTCQKHSLAYLYHLFQVRENLGWQLVGQHNLYFYSALMKEMREHILQNTFYEYYLSQRKILVQTDPLRPPKNTVPSKRKRVISRILNDHEICENPSGSFSIRHNPSGEVMHSVNDPSSEAEALYINQSKLIVKLREDSEEPLRVWDVGLGGATNAMAAIRAYEMLHSSGKERLRPLHIVSFENNLDSLKLALKHPNLLPHIRHPGPSTLVEFKEWNSKKSSLQWTLIEGDFIETMKSAPNPDVIYFDPYSAKTNTSLWSLECFQNIHEKCRDQSIELYTYSSSTAVRAALLGAGFFVARGVGTGPKSETTVALSQSALEKVFSFSLLSSQWLERWKKSHTKFPSDLPDSAHLDFQARILNHPQFAN